MSKENDAKAHVDDQLERMHIVALGDQEFLDDKVTSLLLLASLGFLGRLGWLLVGQLLGRRQARVKDGRATRRRRSANREARVFGRLKERKKGEVVS